MAMASCSESTFLPTALAPSPRPHQQQQQQQQQQAQALDHGPSLHTVKMPATYTAFTSRIGLSCHEERELARRAKALGMASSPMPVDLPGPSARDASGIDAVDDNSSACAIVDDDEAESDWEDDDADDDDATNGRLVFSRVAQPPARSLASNLSLLLRQAQSAKTASTGAPHAPPAPFSTGRTTLPNPLRCHPGLAAASLTPESTMSPPMPPPPPPSSPCGSVPLPSAPATAAPSVSGGSYTSSSSAPSSSVGSASTSTSSSSASASASASASSGASPVMRINQLSALHAPLYRHGSMQSIIDNNGDSLLAMPFNGGLGPRAAPIIHLGPPSPHGAGRRAICSGSGLLESELTGSLRTSIMDENNSRYIFKHYGSRRYVEDGPDGQDGQDGQGDQGGHGSTPGYPPSVHPAGLAAADTPAFRRTQSAPNIPHTSRAGTSSLYMRGKMPVRRICYVDDYEAPKSWNWGMDYHAHGW